MRFFLTCPWQKQTYDNHGMHALARSQSSEALRSAVAFRDDTSRRELYVRYSNFAARTMRTSEQASCRFSIRSSPSLRLFLSRNSKLRQMSRSRIANCVRHAGFFESFLLRLRPVGFYERLRIAFPVAAFGASGSVGRVIGKISRTYAAHISRNAAAKRGSGRRLSHMTVSGSRSCLPR